MKRVFSWFLVAVLILSIGIHGKIVSAAEGKEKNLEQEKAEDLEEVKEKSFPAELPMYYDDHLDMSGKEVEIVDAGTPGSFQVGYGVEEGTPDEAVLCLDGETLVAVGTGSAKINVDGQECVVTVTAAPISLFLLAGQSNMEGLNGNPDQSIICPEGQVYESFGDVSILNRYTAAYLAPSALTGNNRLVNTKGTTEYLCDYPVYALTEEGQGKPGPDSGLAYEWVKVTGEKVWLVNVSHSGASMNTFQKYCNNYEAAQFLYMACEETLKKEIAAGHYTLSHLGMFWCQGCADDNNAANWYVSKFLAMYENLKKDLSIDLDDDPSTPENTIEFVNIIMAMAGSFKHTGYRMGTDRPESSDFYSTYKELEMRGHRVGQYWLAANPEWPEINVVCNLAEGWVTMPDGTDNVQEYFESHYQNGVVDYPTHLEQSLEWRTPTKAQDVKNTIHYNQIGYNEIGLEAAKNTCILLGYLDDTDEATSVRFVDWTGYREVSEITPFTYGVSGSLVVPVITPVYRMQSVTYEVTEGVTYEYFDLLTDYITKEGRLDANEVDNVSVRITQD